MASPEVLGECEIRNMLVHGDVKFSVIKPQFFAGPEKALPSTALSALEANSMLYHMVGDDWSVT